MLLRRLIIIAACAGLLGGLAGCGSSARGSHAGASSSAGPGSSVRQQAPPVWEEFVRCARSHGAPNFPDPQVDDQGRAQFGTDPQQVKRMARQVQGACESILQRLPASARTEPPVSAADLQHLRQFANCIRLHGIPNWPDPKPDGTFPIVGTPLGSEGKSPRWLAADRACRQYWSRGISGS
jgi:hypothetical protein